MIDAHNYRTSMDHGCRRTVSEVAAAHLEHRDEPGATRLGPDEASSLRALQHHLGMRYLEAAPLQHIANSIRIL